MKETASAPLYIVATPIGNRDDITLRAIVILKSVDHIAAEDTRHTGLLLQHLGIHKKLIALHDHNEQHKAKQLLSQLKKGLSIALVSDAGTPLINDPGYHLVKLCHQHNIRVIPIPGACAAIAALSVAGLPSDRFCYEGFLPAKIKARRDKLLQLQEETRTLILYESTHRLLASLNDIADILGKDRYIVLVKELTKCWETVIGMPANNLITWLRADETRLKGEFVLVIEGYTKSDKNTFDQKVIDTLHRLMAELPVKKAAALTAEIFGVSKNQLYKRALKMTPSDSQKE